MNLSRLASDQSPLRIAFFGTPEFAVPTLRILASNPAIAVQAVVTQPDRPAGRGSKLQMPAIKSLAIELGIPVLQPEIIRRNLPEFLNQLSQNSPFDGAVVVAFGHILPIGLIDYFHGKCINIHASLLPRYRGAAPIQRAIMAGEDKTGVCLMAIEEGLDSGPVFAVAETQIAPEDSYGTLQERLSQIGSKLIEQQLVDILTGKSTAKMQDNSLATHAAKISKSEAAVSWQLPAVQISRNVRALWPTPGAFTILAGKRLRIVSTAVVNDQTLPDERELKLQVGELFIPSDRKQLIVGTGASSALSLLMVQPEGKRVLNITEYLAGHNLQTGTFFDGIL